VPRPYETVLIFDSSLDETQLGEKVERLQRILAGDGQAAVQVVHWGKRKLAYTIGKREQGIYVILRYETDTASLNEFERVARIDEQILRHLTIVNPPEAHVVGAEAAPASAGAFRAEGGRQDRAENGDDE
jgi:small subunit ribosomal protein S6